MSDYYRNKINSKELITTFDDVLILPGYTKSYDVDIGVNMGKYHFNLPIMTAAMDTVTEEEMAIKMALLGGLGVIHRNCSYEKQLDMCISVKRARSFVIQDVATINVDATVKEAKYHMEEAGISGVVVINNENKACGIFTKRDIPYREHEIRNGKVKDYMTTDIISIEPGASREQALAMLFKNRIEKLPIISDGYLKGLITIKDLKPEFPNASIDNEGRLLCALAISPQFPETSQVRKILQKIDQYVDIFFTDVADFYKQKDFEGTKKLMKFLDSNFVLGNIGTYEAAEHILTKAGFPEDKLIGIKVGMGSGSICSTSIQTGVGAPTIYATAQVADAINDYNPDISLIADGGFKNPGDLPKSFSVGADLIMSGHFFAGCTESPGYIDTIQGRKVKVYRGMGSKEARKLGGKYIADRYVEEAKSLPEGVSDYVPYVGPLAGVVESLKEGLSNGMIYAGAQNINEMKRVKIGLVSPVGLAEQKPHDLMGKY
ncbi:MAG: CBS domain-containing protein [Candidatus Lokiarchaeota archaeon]|nr:CBS domain-containing protein [Candidatus Lokiarchaeota archaeon]MBD3202083.1 CBS domain-containing protein [Candidatus Lokiarchaeota archaeon]